MSATMDPVLVDSLRILKKFFDDVHRKLPKAFEETLVCLSLDHILCLFSGLAILYDFECQPFDAENITNIDQSKFFYELRCLLNHAAAIKHLKLVPGTGTNLGSRDRIDLGDLVGLRTLEIKAIPHTLFRGFDVLCNVLESVTCSRSQVPSIKTVLSCPKRTRSKRGKEEQPSTFPPQAPWSNLKILKLRNNNIVSIDDTISLAKNLEVLDLVYNKIGTSEVSLECLPKLESLLLNYNSITSLSTLLSPAMSRLVQLSLSYNLLLSLEGLEGLTSLRELDISHNLIMFPEGIGQLKSLKRLVMLEIVGNPLCSEKGYRKEVIKKLHPAVIDQVKLDGRKLTVGEKKLFLRTFDTPDNPILVVSHDDRPLNHSPTGSVHSKRGRRPIRVVENIPDQTNFQDDEDFFISSSFYEGQRGGGRDHCADIIGHFGATHENFRPDGIGGESTPDARGALEDKKEVKEKGEEEKEEGVAKRASEVQGAAPGETIVPTMATTRLWSEEEAVRLLMDSSADESLGGVRIEVEAIIEKPRVEEEEGEEVDGAESDGGLSEEFESALSLTLDTSHYFDARQSYDSPSIERHVGQIVGTRPTLDLRGPRVGPGLYLGRLVFFGMSPEEQEQLLKDLSPEERRFDILPLGSKAGDDDDFGCSCNRMTCIVRGHWLLVVLSSDLPRLEVADCFDLKAVRKVVEVGDNEVKVEFDTLKKDRTERTFVGDAKRDFPAGEFVAALRQFISNAPKQQMLECLKCGHLFKDEQQFLRTKWPFEPHEVQACPQCSSAMVIESTHKKLTLEGLESRGGTTGGGTVGGESFLSKISKQLSRPDLGSIEEVLNRSLNCEMGYVQASPSHLTSSGAFQTRRKFIERGIIGGDEEVHCYVDEEGQEAV